MNLFEVIMGYKNKALFDEFQPGWMEEEIAEAKVREKKKLVSSLIRCNCDSGIEPQEEV